MSIYLIAVIKEKKSTIGYRILDVESKATKDTGAITLREIVKAGKVNIDNIEIKDGELVGTNGALDRYSVIDRNGNLVGSSSIVILEEIGTEGYKACDYKGTIGNYRTADVIRFAKQKNCGIANGKVVTKDGKEFISSIKGEYEETDVKKEAEKREYTGDGTYTDEIKKKIEVIKASGDYKDTFTEKVIATIEEYKKCSYKQKAVIDAAYKKCIDKKNKEEADKKAAEQLKANNNIPMPVATKEADEKIEAYSNKEREEEKYANEVDNRGQYELLTGQFDKGLYITGISNRRYTGKVVIPESINGQRVYGIAPEAFKNTNVTVIVASSGIVDIGYGAFYGCDKMTIIDLSKATHTFIPHHMCFECTKLEHAIIGGKVEKIHESAFAGCIKLSEINIGMTSEIAAKAFYGCRNIEHVEHLNTVNRLAQSVFEKCYRLTSYRFTGLQSIGPSAFKYSGIEKAVIPGTVRDIGNKAFYCCFALSRVDIEEGVDSCGEYCFYRTTNESSAVAARLEMGGMENIVISTPKTLINISNHCFDEVNAVEVWTGSGAESYCKAFGNTMVYKDDVDKDNSANARIVSVPLNIDVIKQIDTILEKDVVGASNPEIKLDESKLINVDLTDGISRLLGINCTGTGIVPKAKFIGAVNYLTAVSTLYITPLKQSVMRLVDTIEINATEIFNDSCNAIYKLTYTTKDLQESGSIIMVIINKVIRYVTDCNIKTNIEISDYVGENDRIPLKYLHVGDTIGKVYCVAGQSKPLDGATVVKFGERLLGRFLTHGVMIRESIKNKLLYVPAIESALHLVDDRKYDKDGRVDKNTPDCLKIKGIYSEKEFIEKMNELNKAVKSDREYFDSLANMSNYSVEQRVKNINIVPEERISHLYFVAKEVKATADRLGREEIYVNDLSLATINSMMKSYYVVEKDIDWYTGTGKRSLNKINECVVGDDRKFQEFRSNQVVKFSNPYMAGCKGAYVFVITSGRSICAVYASVYSMQDIIQKLIKIATVPKMIDGSSYPTIYASGSIESVDAKLFYDFYDLLYSKGGWSTDRFDDGFRTYAYDGFNFTLSMYKPTGVFYIVSKLFSRVKTRDKNGEIVYNDKIKVALPLFKVGDMDRALLVASTTNSGASKSRLLEFLTSVVQDWIASNNSVPSRGWKKDSLGFYEARKMAYNGNSNVNDYIPLIGNRLVYIIGTRANELKADSINGTNIMQVQAEYIVDEDIVDEDIVDEDIVDEDIVDEVVEDFDYDMGEMEISSDDDIDSLIDYEEADFEYDIDEEFIDEDTGEYDTDETGDSDNSDISDVVLEELNRIKNS